MGRSSLQLKNYKASDIKDLFHGENKYRIGMRLYAVCQVANGVPSRKLEELYNTSFKQICNWVHNFDEYGIDGLIDKAKSGRTPKLSSDRQAELKSILESSTPEDYGYNTATWSGAIVLAFVKNKWGVEYKKAQIYNILRKLGFSYQRAKGVYPEADRQKQKEFSARIKKLQTEDETTAILFQDEFSLSNTATLSRGWGLRGRQPKIDLKQRGRERRTVLGSVNYRTGQMTLNIELKDNSHTFINHLDRVELEYREAEKIIMLLDNVRFHHSKIVNEWFAEHPKFELLFLPPYSPDLNPIQHVWWFMRKSVTHNRFVETMEARIERFGTFFEDFLKPNEKIQNVCVINF